MHPAPKAHPLRLRAMPIVVGWSNAPGGTTTCTPSGPVSVPPAESITAVAAVGSAPPLAAPPSLLDPPPPPHEAAAAMAKKRASAIKYA